jgi:hypothetical protein
MFLDDSQLKESMDPSKMPFDGKRIFLGRRPDNHRARGRPPSWNLSADVLSRSTRQASQRNGGRSDALDEALVHVTFVRRATLDGAGSTEISINSSNSDRIIRKSP